MRRIEDLKKKENYREIVKKRNNLYLEEKKNKTLWRLEKLDIKSSPQGKQMIRDISKEGIEEEDVRGGYKKSP